MLEDARARVAAVLKDISRLKQSDFPYAHTSDALDLLEKRFRWHENVLKKASATTQIAVLHNACRDSLRELYVYVPILGFLLRATNVRNAFEVYSPLQRLVHKIMGDDAKLIVSSEWEFSPFVYRAIIELPGFVLVGLPAPESSNPLVIPLSGHELGHSIWEHGSFSLKYENLVYDGILKELFDNKWDDYLSLYPQYSKKNIEDRDMFAELTWRPAYTWTLLQIEEMFCDFLGVRLFSESFLNAFAYLLSPGVSGLRSLRYPNIKRRILHIVQAAKEMGVEVPKDYDSSFQKESEPTDPTTKLLVSLADAVSASFEQELIKEVKDFADNKQVPRKSPDSVKRIGESFRAFVVPIKEPESLVDIVNAGWECNMDKNLWERIPNIKLEDRGRILLDIVLKSMEIAEIYERLEKKS